MSDFQRITELVKDANVVQRVTSLLMKVLCDNVFMWEWAPDGSEGFAMNAKPIIGRTENHNRKMFLSQVLFNLPAVRSQVLLAICSRSEVYGASGDPSVQVITDAFEAVLPTFENGTMLISGVQNSFSDYSLFKVRTSAMSTKSATLTVQRVKNFNVTPTEFSTTFEAKGGKAPTSTMEQMYVEFSSELISEPS